MTEAIKWRELTAVQRDRIVAEKIMGVPANADVHILHYTTSMDAAWVVVQRLWELHTSENAYRVERKFLGYLSGMISSECGMTMGCFTLEDLATLTPEDVCIAALLACGVKIDREP